MKLFVAIVGCLLVWPAFGWAQPARPDRNASRQRFELLDGAVLQHDQYDGVLMRIEKGRTVARVKVPKARPFAESTQVVVSENEMKVLVVYQGDSTKWPARHSVLILDARSLKKQIELPLGACTILTDTAYAEMLRLLCQGSTDPSAPTKARTFAFVVMDLDRGVVPTWFNLGGEHRGMWFGPMFFGFRDDARPVEVRRDRCAVVGTEPKPPMTRDTNVYVADPSRIEALPVAEDASDILVIARDKGASNGDVWFVGPEPTAIPRRVRELSRSPVSAVLCGQQLQVILKAEEPSPASR